MANIPLEFLFLNHALIAMPNPAIITVITVIIATTKITAIAQAE